MTELEAIEKIEGGWMPDEEVAECFQVLIDSGIVWHLQGRYGREAAELIETGMCYPKGANPN
jgi:hypothetical protein